jgi:tellurite resistance protein TerC
VEILNAAMSMDVLGTPAAFWLIFLAVVAILLAFDLGILHHREHEIGARESIALYSGYVAIALLFGAWVWWTRGTQAGLEFYTGYIIEQSLAMDNIFVIATIFGFLAVPRAFQHRVLFWGILGAIVLRAILIGFGAALVAQFSWVLLLFGVFLVFTGFRMFRSTGENPDIANNRLLAWLRQHFRLTDTYHGHHFIIRRLDPTTGRNLRFLTPLAAALVMVECVDLIFAVDSVPAIFAVTQDTFVVYTSNIFAIMGLRALYFALAAAVHRFAYLQYSLATLLVLVGAKVLLVPFGIKIDTAFSLAMTVIVLASGVGYSLWRTRRA